MNACYSPAPSRRKKRAALWLFLSLDGPGNFRIEDRPVSPSTMKPYKKSCSGAVGAKDFHIQQSLVIAEASRHTRKSQAIQHRRSLNRPCLGHCNRTRQRYFRLFHRIPRDKPVADTEVKSSFEPACLPVDRDELPDQVRWQLAIEISPLVKMFGSRRLLLTGRESEPRHALNHNQSSGRREKLARHRPIVKGIVVSGNVAGLLLRFRHCPRRPWQNIREEHRYDQNRHTSHHGSSIASSQEHGQFMDSGMDKLARSVDNPTNQVKERDVRDKTQSNQRPLWIGAIALCLLASGCKPDDSPFKAENESLRKQLARQESVITSLQDGNKVMQQQIDLLNQELRDARKASETAKADAKAAADNLAMQLAQTKKLSADVQKTAATQAAQHIHVEEKEAQTENIPRPLSAVARTVEETLSRNGYHVKVSIKTDQKAVYVTERKISPPASLEIAGSRNQYILSLRALPSNVTRLSVKADFEKLAQGGRILSVSAEEVSEIERSLIREITKTLASSGKT